MNCTTGLFRTAVLSSTAAIIRLACARIISGSATMPTTIATEQRKADQQLAIGMDSDCILSALREARETARRNSQQSAWHSYARVLYRLLFLPNDSESRRTRAAASGLVRTAPGACERDRLHLRPCPLRTRHELAHAPARRALHARPLRPLRALAGCRLRMPGVHACRFGFRPGVP
jgi:hypothetical protein